MSKIHPGDEQLLLHADGEGDPTLEAHVAACPECRAAVDAATRGGQALRSAPLLELPAGHREAALASLPPRERSRRPRRFVVVAVPLVALASIVAVVGLSRGTADPERAAEQMVAQDAARDAPPAALEAAPADEEEAARAPAAVVRSVAGPPDAVAGLLRAEGLDARVVDGAVEVWTAESEEVDEALSGRPDGPVEVRLVGP